MIIVCEECRTKYRFDVSTVEGPCEGIWVRCSRCRYVFYHNLFTDENAEKAGVETASRPIPGVPEEGSLTSAGGDTDREIPIPPPRRGISVRWMGLGALLLATALVFAAYFLYPDEFSGVLRGLSSTVPVLSDFVKGDAPRTPEGGPAAIAMADLRQRFVKNAIMGDIRIVEGMAVNRAKHTVTRIKVAAELFDVVNTRVGESTSFCGNILTDQELGVMAEEQIQRELGLPQGSDVSNDRIEPGASIPFMIVFVREPPGVVKTLVYPVQAERLLD